MSDRNINGVVRICSSIVIKLIFLQIPWK